MEDDTVPLVDENDNVIGSKSKVDAHLRVLLEKELLPHRAFSLLLFNSKNELLLQQRSTKKITFPLMWTNSCCSHPRYCPEELEEKDFLGIKRATVRRASFELAIQNHELRLEDLHVGSRILYYADGCETFAEYELDYIIFARKDLKH
jgi:isopentenyl-diphosphate delta-isomerase